MPQTSRKPVLTIRDSSLERKKSLDAILSKKYPGKRPLPSPILDETPN